MEAQGQEITTFFAEHKVRIQHFMMVGHGKGWLNCDTLSLSPLHGDAPQFIMDFETFSAIMKRGIWRIMRI